MREKQRYQSQTIWDWKRERYTLCSPPTSEKEENHMSLSSRSKGSQALDLTKSWGSLSPCPIAVFWRRISKFSCRRQFYCRAFLLLLLKVARILGSSQLIVPEVQWRACLDISEIFSSGLLEKTSLRCCSIRVPKRLTDIFGSRTTVALLFIHAT